MPRNKPTNKRPRPGQPPFEPTDQQRQFVAAMTGLRMTWEEMSLVIINPRTGKHISKETLQRAFAEELTAGKAKLKTMINSKYIERLQAGDAWAIQFGFRHIHGWKDSDLTIGVNGDGAPASSIQVSFVAPQKAKAEEA